MGSGTTTGSGTLELWTGHHPHGVRVSDLIAYLVDAYPESVATAVRAILLAAGEG